jgi:hypothetical protein
MHRTESTTFEDSLAKPLCGLCIFALNPSFSGMATLSSARGAVMSERILKEQDGIIPSSEFMSTNFGREIADYESIQQFV